MTGAALERRRLALPCRLGEITLAHVTFDVLVLNAPLEQAIARQLPGELVRRYDTAGAQGLQIKGAFVGEPSVGWSVSAGMIEYIYSVYPRYYFDFEPGLQAYRSRFSSKSLYNLRRQRRLYFEHVGSPEGMVVARTPQEVETFYACAREVSRLTYQERLLSAGLPDHDEFHRKMRQAAEKGDVRGFLLPGRDGTYAAYMYCLRQGDDLVCKYIGYDPSVAKFSPGATLLLMAIEALFAEGGFRRFDFEEGGAQYKKQFSTDSIDCGNVLVLPATLGNFMRVSLHRGVGAVARLASRLLQNTGLKDRIRKLIRYRATAT